MKISIITVTYNSGKTLSNTIESILAQSYHDIEYIVIDGASRDHTVDLLRLYEPQFKGRMRWISEPDEGLYDAINKGICMATGEVVGILNSDDFYTSHDAVFLIASAFSSDVDAVYGDVHFVKAEDLKHIVRYYSSKIFKRSLMRMGFMPAHPTFYCRKRCYEQWGYYKTDYKIAADFDLLLRFIYVNRIRMKYLPVDLVTMRLGGVSTHSWKSHVQITKEHLRSFSENKVKSNVFLLSLRYFYKLSEFFRK